MPAPSLMQHQSDDKDQAVLEIGQPIIVGSMGGVGVGSVTPLSFSISYNFGELSPINQNPIVKITIPITVRISLSYRITLSMAKPAISDPNAVQYSDIGVGIQNLRLLGLGLCPGAIQPPFDNDPATAMTINSATGRATYPSSLANVNNNTVVIRGPGLPPQGAAFDLIFAAAPQFYTPGNFNFVVTVRLQPNSVFICL